MRIQLAKKPKNPTIIQGFPGFGLIGTISTEFLIEHLKPELIGEFIFDELPPTVAIHQGKLVKPMEIFYEKKYNLIILHTILPPKGFEWQVAEEIVKMATTLSAKKIICLEGVLSPEGDGVLFYGDKALEKLGAKPIQESIIMGVTASVMARYKKAVCLFGESHSQMPDSKTAAKIIEVIASYLGLQVDTKPLLKQAEEFEKKFQTIMDQTQKAGIEKNRKEMSYLG